VTENSLAVILCRVPGRCPETIEILIYIIYIYIKICRFESSLCKDNQRVGRSRSLWSADWIKHENPSRSCKV